MKTKLLLAAAFLLTVFSAMPRVWADDEPDSVVDLDDVPRPKLPPRAPGQTDKERLGQIFAFDTRFSNPPGQSCITCHEARQGFGGPIAGQMPGAVHGRAGKRTAPSLRYIAFSPKGPVLTGGQYVGGKLWDASAEDITQLGAPFDPNEMNNASTPDPLLLLRHGYSKDIARKIRKGPHRKLFISVYHQLDGSSDRQLFVEFMDAIQTFIESPLMNPFSSKYDDVIAGKAEFTAAEQRGNDLFFGRAGCSNCHSSAGLPVLGLPNPKGHELFSMFCLSNTGVARNPDNPFYKQTDPTTNPKGFNPLGEAFIDLGLGANPFGSTAVPAVPDLPGFPGTGSPAVPSVKFFNLVPGDILEFRGLFKTPHLRNVLLRESFFHNGSETTLRGVIERDSDRNIAVNAAGKRVAFDLNVGPPPGYKRLHPPPEVAENVVNSAGKTPAQGNPNDNATSGELGNLQLSKADIDDLLEFFEALTDKDLLP